jgi:deoxyribose-phosphate aldolase
MNLDLNTAVDQVGIEERVARFNTRSIKKQSKVQALKLALNMIDLTTLEGKIPREK